MKFVHICALTPLLLLSLTTYTQREAPDATEEVEEIQQVENPKAQVIIHSVANIVAHVGSIAGDKHNKPNICHNVAGIIGNIANIILAAKHHRCKTEQELLDYLINDLHLDELLTNIIEQEMNPT